MDSEQRDELIIVIAEAVKLLLYRNTVNHADVAFMDDRLSGAIDAARGEGE